MFLANKLRVLSSEGAPPEDLEWDQVTGTAGWTITYVNGVPRIADFVSVSGGVQWQISDTDGSDILVEVGSEYVVTPSDIRMDGGESYTFTRTLTRNNSSRSGNAVALYSVPNSDGSGTRTQLIDTGLSGSDAFVVPANHAAFVILHKAQTVYNSLDYSLLFFTNSLSSMNLTRNV